MAYEKDPNELGALWVRVSANGTRYMSGTITGIGAVVCFENKNKGEKRPDWRVLRSQPKGERPAPRVESPDADDLNV